MHPGNARLQAGSPEGRGGALCQSLALASFVAGEMLLFWLATSRHYAWVYPRWFDQLQYLSEAYDAGNRMRASGFVAGAHRALAHISPQGSLHGFFALLVFAVTGPSRMSALAVNMVAFVALQAITFFAVRRVSGSYAFAWAAVGLLAALHAPWSGGPGSATDFRLDWMAACAYGVALGVGVAGQGFRSLRWALLFGVAVGVVLLTRYLSAVYFGIIFIGLSAWLLTRPHRWKSCGYLCLSALVAAAIAGAPFWRARSAIYAYYWVGHFGGPEAALRNSHLPLWPSVKWMASDLLFVQVGIAAAILGATAAVGFFVAGIVNAGREGARAEPPRPKAETWAIVIAFFAAPAAVLTAHPDKVSQPAAIILPGAVWIIILVWLHLARRAGRNSVVGMCAAVAIVGASLFVVSQARQPLTAAAESEFREVNALDDFLFFRSEEAGLTRPRIAVTWWLDSLNAGTFQVLGLERHQRLLHFTGILPTGLFSAAQGVVMERLADADFVCLVTKATQEWPFDREMTGMLPAMRAFCDRNLTHVGDLDTAEFSAMVYERPFLARGPEASGVDLRAMMAAASRDAPNAVPSPPARPLIAPHQEVRWTTRSDVNFVVKAAYSPLRFQAVDMPAGLSIDPISGEIRGRLPHEGNFNARISVSNSRGSTDAALEFQVADAAWGAWVSPPEKAVAGVPVEIGFEVYDVSGMLNFIDITDLTAVKTLDRLAANEDERRNWRSVYRATFGMPGRHRIQLRFVRYDPASTQPYSYLDRICLIDVAP